MDTESDTKTLGNDDCYHFMFDHDVFVWEAISEWEVAGFDGEMEEVGRDEEKVCFNYFLFCLIPDSKCFGTPYSPTSFDMQITYTPF